MRYDILNSEGTIIWAKPIDEWIELNFTQAKWKIKLTREEFEFFILGRLIIDSPDGESHNYPEYSSGMKPKPEILELLLKRN
jgi:hypothetical protein